MKKNFHSDELKKRVAEEIISGLLTVCDASIKYSVSERTIFRWQKRFKKFIKKDEKLTLSAMKENINSDRELSKEELLAIKSKLEKELKQALLKAQANEILVDIAKEDYNIDLRKKHGAKQ